MARKNGIAATDEAASEEQITRPPRAELVRWSGETLALHQVLVRTDKTESALLETGAEFRSADIPNDLLERPEFVDVETTGGGQ